MTIKVRFDWHRLLVGLTWRSRTTNCTNDSSRNPDGYCQGNDWSQKWDRVWEVLFSPLPCVVIELVWVRYDQGKHYSSRTKRIVNTPHPEHGRLRQNVNTQGR